MHLAYEPTIDDLEVVLEKFNRRTTHKELEALFHEYIANNSDIEEAALAAEVMLDDDEVTLNNQTNAANEAIIEALFEADEIPNAIRCEKSGRIIPEEEA